MEAVVTGPSGQETVNVEVASTAPAGQLSPSYQEPDLGTSSSTGGNRVPEKLVYVKNISRPVSYDECHSLGENEEYGVDNIQRGQEGGENGVLSVKTAESSGEFTSSELEAPATCAPDPAARAGAEIAQRISENP